MAPPDDAEVDGDGDELLEWLWDLPERYDVGIDDDPLGSGPVPVPAAPVVRKHLRKPGETEAAAEESAAEPTPTPPPLRIPSASPFWIPSQPSTPTWGPSPNPTRYDDRPTLAVEAVDPYAGEGDGLALATILASDHRPSRYNFKDIASAVAVFLVVAIAVGGGYTLLRDTGSHKNHVAVGSTSTTLATTNGQGIVPPITAATSTTSTTEPATTTTISVPAVAAATTTTTRCATALADVVPNDPTGVSQVSSSTSSTSSTVAGTTSTTVMATTTTTTPAGTTTTELTLPPPPTTTTTTPPTTVPRTTTTVKKSTTTTTICR